ncbi:hypothetical protein NP493_415g00031 [Ridgeia piscesae]|uniref:Uncharacterized protein n=1 Tax=Ridgeia piscesae TaxID=27915 RepID=A0AAD9NSD2_RIDPI|nr:hypothetical protein NP493_415g00031 [Ridgeia piscesae]
MICSGICQKVVITGEGFFECDARQCEFTKTEHLKAPRSNAVITDNVGTNLKVSSANVTGNEKDCSDIAAASLSGTTNIGILST